MTEFPLSDLKLGEVGILTHIDGTGPSLPGDPVVGGWAGTFVCPRTNTGGDSRMMFTNYRWRPKREGEFVVL